MWQALGTVARFFVFVVVVVIVFGGGRVTITFHVEGKISVTFISGGLIITPLSILVLIYFPILRGWLHLILKRVVLQCVIKVSL